MKIVDHPRHRYLGITFALEIGEHVNHLLNILLDNCVNGESHYKQHHIKLMSALMDCIRQGQPFIPQVSHVAATGSCFYNHVNNSDRSSRELLDYAYTFLGYLKLYASKNQSVVPYAETLIVGIREFKIMYAKLKEENM